LLVDRHLKQVLYKDDIPTPALLLDLDAFDSNLSKMAGHLKQKGIQFRPHAKTHKCPTVARRQLAEGARGICVAKLSEAEVMISEGIENILVTSEIVNPAKISRLVALSLSCPGLMCVVDQAQTVADFTEAAETKKTKLKVLVDIDGGRHRTGSVPGQPALEVAEQIARSKWLEFCGIQCYAGHIAHTVGFEARKRGSKEALERALETKVLIEKRGIPVQMMTGGSTGSYNIDSDIPGFTELQAGSYIFMDLDYECIGSESQQLFLDFDFALSVLTTVISKSHSHLATVDGGFKAFATDKLFTPRLKNISGVSFRWAGDEHGILELKQPSQEIKLKDRLEFLTPHCDPTINLYDHLYAVRGNKVEDVWPIAARGCSQ
jgi:D-serine deaminase-like pyridoxal phosphate-dependent protein